MRRNLHENLEVPGISRVDGKHPLMTPAPLAGAQLHAGVAAEAGSIATCILSFDHKAMMRHTAWMVRERHATTNGPLKAWPDRYAPGIQSQPPARERLIAHWSSAQRTPAGMGAGDHSCCSVWQGQ